MNTPFVEELFVTVQFHPMIAEQKDAGILVELFLFQVPDNLPDLPVGLEEAVIVLRNQASNRWNIRVIRGHFYLLRLYHFESLRASLASRQLYL